MLRPLRGQGPACCPKLLVCCKSMFDHNIIFSQKLLISISGIGALEERPWINWAALIVQIDLKIWSEEMGKRKSSAKAPAKKARAKLETTFTCPFCNAGTFNVELFFYEGYMYGFERLNDVWIVQKNPYIVFWIEIVKLGRWSARNATNIGVLKFMP